MKVPLHQKESLATQAVLLEAVLANWMIVVRELMDNYRQLTSLVDSCPENRSALTQQSVGIGQCPRQELIQLIDRFEQELDTLLEDISRPVQLSPLSYADEIDRLLTHTARLDELNRQASIRLIIATQSAT